MNHRLGVALGESSRGGPTLAPECPSQSMAPRPLVCSAQTPGDPPDPPSFLTLCIQCIRRSRDCSFKLPLFSSLHLCLHPPGQTSPLSLLGDCHAGDRPAYWTHVTMLPPIDLLSAARADSLTHDLGVARTKPGWTCV